MNFGQIIIGDCENVPTPSDPRCSDPAFAIANPTVCPNGTGGLGGTLVLKPGTALACTLGSVQFEAVLVKNGIENVLTANLTFASSDMTVAVIGASSGNATGVGAGTCTVTATYVDPTTGNILTASASLTVLAGTNCCSEVTVAMMLVIDVTNSMGQPFGGSYPTRLAFALAAATGFLQQINAPNVSVGLMTMYDGNGTIILQPTTNIASVITAVAAIQGTQNLTGFNTALTSAVAALNATHAMERVIVLISDGEDTSTTDTTDANDSISTSTLFQTAGGIVMGLGCRSNDGFLLMEALCTGGFFINAYPSVVNQALALFYGLKGYACAGNCAPAGNTTVPTPQLDYCNFNNWWISEKTVDLLGPGLYDFLPGNGLYVDLIANSETETFSGNTVGNFSGGLMTLKTPLTLEAGHAYRFAVSIAGNQIRNTPGTLQLQVYSRNSDGMANPSVQPGVSVSESGASQSPTTFAYGYTWVNANGETILSPTNAVTTNTVDAQMTITPTNNPTGGKINIYRGHTGGTFYLIGTITNGNTFVDKMNEADFEAALVAGTVQVCSNPPPLNTTGTVNYVINQQIVVSNYQQEFTQQSFSITAPTDLQVYIALQQISTSVVPGLLLNDVNVQDTTTLVTIFDDNFDTENEQYVPPACGSGSSGGVPYYGYNCYGSGCLNTSPPGAQLPDPNALPNIEAGFTPPVTYTSTQQACATCPSGQLNLSQTAIDSVNNVTIAVPGAGEANIIGPDPFGTTIVGWYKLNLSCTGFSGPFTIELQGTTDNVTFTTLDTESVLGFQGTSPNYQFVIDNPQPFHAYRLFISGAGLLVSSMLADTTYYPGGPSQVCSTATATSTVSQAAADTAATAQAMQQAQAQLTCIPSFTATESFTATCPAGLAGPSVTKTVTFTSLINQQDAQANALAEAQALAQAALVCVCANTNTTKTIINPAPAAEQQGPASPYPSVQCVAGLVGTITKVTVTLTGFTHNGPASAQMLLVSPSGVAVLIYSQCGQVNTLSSNINLVIDDAAGSNLPCGSALSSGTFKPTQCGAPETFPAPAPQTTPAIAMSAFIGENPNGSWLLYIIGVEVFNSGSLNSWQVNIST